MQAKELKQSFSIHYNYSVFFTKNVFSPANSLLKDILTKAGTGPKRVTLAIDSAVLAAWPDLIQKIQTYFDKHTDSMMLAGKALIVKGGEVCKTAPLEVQQLYDQVAEQAICRHSFVLAIGGGAMLDAIGFAAATAHRGVRLIRMPTTVLAQNDAGVGVKNSLNHNNRKNFIGTFTPPFAVINDYSLLASLESRDKRAGIAEAIKVALIKDKAFFYYLHKNRKSLAAFQDLPMQTMIQRCAQLHLEHIANNGDPFERGSARPLDFGHWAAHKLEEITHAALRHGEAVAIGLMLDSLYSWRLGAINEEEIKTIFEVINGLGFNVYHYELRNLNVESALQEFREHLGGRLCITLLENIGSGREFDSIDVSLMQACIEDLERLHKADDSVFDNWPQLNLPLAV